MHPKIKKEIVIGKKIRPVRIVKKRANELMCVIRNESTKSEDIERIDENEVDVDTCDIPDLSSSDDSIPVIKSLDEWLEPIWTED